MPTRYIGDGYWELISRQMSIVTRSQQERFKEAKIAVIGCGGIGGQTIEMLARMGVGQLNLVDEDAFDLSNLNRQTLASISGTIIELYNTDGSAGAARGAGIGAGIYTSPAEAFASLQCTDLIEPEPHKQEQYAEAYARWKKHLMSL